MGCGCLCESTDLIMAYGYDVMQCCSPSDWEWIAMTLVMASNRTEEEYCSISFSSSPKASSALGEGEERGGERREGREEERGGERKEGRFHERMVKSRRAAVSHSADLLRLISKDTEQTINKLRNMLTHVYVRHRVQE